MGDYEINCLCSSHLNVCTSSGQHFSCSCSLSVRFAFISCIRSQPLESRCQERSLRADVTQFEINCLLIVLLGGDQVLIASNFVMLCDIMRAFYYLMWKKKYVKILIILKLQHSSNDFMINLNDHLNYHCRAQIILLWKPNSIKLISGVRASLNKFASDKQICSIIQFRFEYLFTPKDLVVVWYSHL